jgi:bifunctional non-homologous end joining protein LigD
MTKAARVGKIYLDYLRNERGSTAVAPYSPRARAGLPVAVPLSWSELKSDHPPRFQVSEFPQWRKRLSRDPWKEMPGLEQRLVIPESK